MHLLLQLIIFNLAFISYEHMAMAQSYTSIVAPITKHTDVNTNTSLYSVNIMTRWVNMQFLHANFLIDIDAPITWHKCILQWNMYPPCPENNICAFPVSCDEYQCEEVRSSYSYKSPYCQQRLTDWTTLPGWGFCTCRINVVNPVTGTCGQPELNYDEFTVTTSNGRNPLSGLYGAYPNAACGSESLFDSFPENVTGVMAFSSSPYAMPTYLNEPLKKNLALCLPSSSAPGVLFYGKGPYYFLPHSDVDVTSLLSYTPLLKHQDSFGYFIGVKSIVTNGIRINVTGNLSTKLSTTETYTTLRTDLYDRLIQVFSMGTKRYRPESAIDPFRLCLNAGAVEHKRKGLRVPDIVLGLEDGKSWTISGRNSMKKITDDVFCLAFVDGGMAGEHPIVIGTFQMEDNFLQFDLENSTLGFSSSLLNMGSSCGSFNFTTGI